MEKRESSNLQQQNAENENENDPGMIFFFSSENEIDQCLTLTTKPPNLLRGNKCVICVV